MTKLRIWPALFLIVGLTINTAYAVDYFVCAAGCDFTTIQSAIDDIGTLDGDTINLDAETYGPFILDKSLTIKGVQAGVSACDRTGDESVIMGAATLIEFTGGSAGSVIDGLHLSGGTTGLSSSSGPIDGLKILNNLINGFTSSGVFLNDSGVDITVAQNRIDGSSQTGGGGLFHLDTDNFDGFHFVDNCVVNSASGPGFFVDGNRNVGVSSTRAPLFTGNLFDGMAQNVGANVGTRAIEFATIDHNTFSNNAYDGIQGGIKGSLISQNSFFNNGRAGLLLTGFGSSDPTKGALSNTVTNNCFIQNGLVQAGGAGIRLTSQALAGSQASHTIRDNNFIDNILGALNSSADDVMAENNWWGAADGPSGDGAGSGDAVDGTSGGGSIDFDPFLIAQQPNTPCSSTTTETTPDHYQCYEVVGETVDEVVELKDQFADTLMMATTPDYLCAPVDKNGEGVADEETHMTCYNVIGDQPSESVNKDVEVSNQFGQDQLLSVKQPQTLCVPSTKVVIGDTPVPPASCADGKPKELVFEYTGGSCGDTSNFQDGKFKCSDDPAGAEPVEIVVTGKDASKVTVSPGSVSVGDSFSIASNNGSKLPKSLKLEVQQGGNTLQKLEIHTSCSKSLEVDDVFGSLILELFVPE